MFLLQDPDRSTVARQDFFEPDVSVNPLSAAVRGFGAGMSLAPTVAQFMLGDDEPIVDELPSLIGMASRGLKGEIRSLVDTAAENATLYRARQEDAMMQSGMASNLSYGLSYYLSGFVGGGLNPASYGLGLGKARMETEIRAGVDEDTAFTIGAIEGVTAGVGATIPFLGKTVAQRFGFGVAANVVPGIAQRKAEQVTFGEVYAERAPDLFDPVALAVDAVMGGAFGYLSGLGAKPETIPVDAINDALDANINVRSGDAAPGFPNPKAFGIHMRMVKETIDAQNEGRAPDYTPLLDAEFADSPEMIRNFEESLADVTAGRMTDDRPIYDDILPQIEATGVYSAPEARANAKLASMAYTAMAKRMGMNPRDLMDQMPLKVITDAVEGLGQPKKNMEDVADLNALANFYAQDDNYQFDNYEMREAVFDRLIQRKMADEGFEGMDLPTSFGSIVITPSAKESGSWQVTAFDKNMRPLSDEGIQTKEQALRTFFEQARPVAEKPRAAKYFPDGPIAFGPASITPNPIKTRTYRETNLDGLDSLIRNDRDAVPSRAFVTDNPDLAIGQGDNKGVFVTFAEGSVSGRLNPKPGITESTGFEYVTDVIGRGAIESVRVKTDQLKSLRALTRRALINNFDKTVDGDFTTFTRKQPDQLLRQSALPNTIDINGTQRSTLNSEGRPLAQTEEGVRNFWNWFGDSKVVDAEGRPLVVYHGTAADFTAFGTDTKAWQAMTGTDGEFFFTSNKKLAEEYAIEQNVGSEGANVMPVYLSLNDALIVDAAGAAGRKNTLSFIRNTIDQAVDSKNDSVIIRNIEDSISLEQPASDIFIARNQTQIKSAIGNRGTFDPADASILNQEARGTYSPDTNTIGLTRAADSSTFVHELGHHLFEMLGKLASDPNAPTQIRADFETLVKHGGMKVDDWYASDINTRRAAHEKIADDFETYLMTGEAPSLELRNLFGMIRDWMLGVYKTIRGEVQPEVRAVFDRMLATDEQIAMKAQVVDYLAVQRQTEAKANSSLDDNLMAAERAIDPDVEVVIDGTRIKASELLKAEEPQEATAMQKLKECLLNV